MTTTMRSIGTMTLALLVAWSVVTVAAQPRTAEPPRVAPGSAMEKIQKRGKLTAGVRFDVLHLGYLNPQTNKLEGFEVDLARELARAILGDPEKVELKQVTAKSRIPLLQAGEVDLLVANFTVTEERKKALDFGKPHLNLPYWIVVPQDSPYQKLADLNGRRIGEIKGAEFVGDALKARLPKAEILYFDSHPELALALVSKRLDAIEAAGFASHTALEAHPTLRRFKIELDLPENFAAGFRKGQPELVAFWNTLLDQLAARGTLKQLFVKNMPPRMELTALPFDVR